MLLWAKNIKDKIRKLENSPSTIWKKEIENTVLFSVTDVFQRKNTLKTWKKSRRNKTRNQWARQILSVFNEYW